MDGVHLTPATVKVSIVQNKYFCSQWLSVVLHRGARLVKVKVMTCRVRLSVVLPRVEEEQAGGGDGSGHGFPGQRVNDSAQ